MSFSRLLTGWARRSRFLHCHPRLIGAACFAVSLLLAVLATAEPFSQEYLDGLRALQADNLQEAARLLLKAAKAQPNSAAIHSDLGTVYYRQEKFAWAEAEYEAAVRLEPNQAIYHNNLASALIRLNQPEKAKASVEAALRLRADFEDALMNRGVLLLLEHRYAEAEALVQRIRDSRLRALSNLALSQYLQAKWDHALESVDWALAQNPSPERAHTLRRFREQILSMRPGIGERPFQFAAVVKMGYVHRVVSSDYFDSTKAIGAFDAQDFNSFVYEGEFSYRPHKHFSVSGSFGFFDGQETGLNRTTTAGSALQGDVKFKTFYGLVTGKAHYPVRMFDFYVGAGMGWYSLSREVRLTNQVPQVARSAREDKNFSNFGFHGVGGVAVNVTPRFFLLGEVRGFRAQFSDGTNAFEDELDLGPIMYLGGVGIQF